MIKLYLLLFSLSGLTVSGQSLKRQIINSIGGTYTNSGATIRTSGGEPIVGNLDNSFSTLLSQGFFTGAKKINNYISLPAIDVVGFSVYPNPVKDILYFKGDKSLMKQVVFTDLAGKRLFTRSLTSQSVQLSDLPAGFYIARLLGNSNEILNTFKVIKL